MAIPYKNILVPLDGSKLAESAIRDAVSVAEATSAELTFLSVIEPITSVLPVDGEPLYVDEQYDVRRARALEYLDGARHRVAGRPIRLHVAVETGAPADAILTYARDHAVDLIALATHGRSGVKRWLLGSVAEKVLRGADGPVLLVPARTA